MLLSCNLRDGSREPNKINILRDMMQTTAFETKSETNLMNFFDGVESYHGWATTLGISRIEKPYREIAVTTMQAFLYQFQKNLNESCNAKQTIDDFLNNEFLNSFADGDADGGSIPFPNEEMLKYLPYGSTAWDDNDNVRKVAWNDIFKIEFLGRARQYVDDRYRQKHNKVIENVFRNFSLYDLMNLSGSETSINADSYVPQQIDYRFACKKGYAYSVQYFKNKIFDEIQRFAARSKLLKKCIDEITNEVNGNSVFFENDDSMKACYDNDQIRAGMQKAVEGFEMDVVTLYGSNHTEITADLLLEKIEMRLIEHLNNNSGVYGKKFMEEMEFRQDYVARLHGDFNAENVIRNALTSSPKTYYQSQFNNYKPSERICVIPNNKEVIDKVNSLFSNDGITQILIHNAMCINLTIEKLWSIEGEL